MSDHLDEYADALALIRQQRENPNAVLAVVLAMTPVERAVALLSAVSLADWLAERSASGDWLADLQTELSARRAAS